LKKAAASHKTLLLWVIGGAESLDEYFYVVDENDKVVGKATREKCHNGSGLIHRSVYIFVLNGRNEIFIQKRSESKDLYPGYYTGSATGHVEYGESYDEAAERELREELGIEAPLRRLCKFRSFSEDEREISMLYVCRYDGPISFNKEEISEGVFMTLEDIKQSLRTGNKKFAYGFKVAFRELAKRIGNVCEKD